jgi:hypothetical protein
VFVIVLLNCSWTSCQIQTSMIGQFASDDLCASFIRGEVLGPSIRSVNNVKTPSGLVADIVSTWFPVFMGDRDSLIEKVLKEIDADQRIASIFKSLKVSAMSPSLFFFVFLVFLLRPLS